MRVNATFIPAGLPQLPHAIWSRLDWHSHWMPQCRSTICIYGTLKSRDFNDTDDYNSIETTNTCNDIFCQLNTHSSHFPAITLTCQCWSILMLSVPFSTISRILTTLACNFVTPSQVLWFSLMATWTKASSLTSEPNQLSMADHTDTVDQGAQYAKSGDDVREGQSSANGNGQPTPKRARVPSDQALPEDEIVVDKRAKPNLSEACAKAYKDLRNTSVRLVRLENQRDCYKKYLDLSVVPAFMRYNSVPSLGGTTMFSKLTETKSLQVCNENSLISNMTRQSAWSTKPAKRRKSEKSLQIRAPTQMNSLKPSSQYVCVPIKYANAMPDHIQCERMYHQECSHICVLSGFHMACYIFD